MKLDEFFMTVWLDSSYFLVIFLPFAFGLFIPKQKKTHFPTGNSFNFFIYKNYN